MAVGLGIAGFQRRVVEEGRQGRHLLVAAEVEGAGGADQFFQVFHPSLPLFALFFLVEGDQAGLFDDLLHQIVQGQVLGLERQGIDQLDEDVERRGGATGHRAGTDQVVQRLPQ